MNSWHIGSSIVLQNVIKDPRFRLRAIFVRPLLGGKSQYYFEKISSVFKRGNGVIGFLSLGLLTVWYFFPMILFDLLGFGIFLGIKKYLKSPPTIAKEHGVPCYDINDIHEQKNIAMLHALKPDILLSNHFNQILKKEVLQIPTLGTFNLHPGKIPEYKGLFPTFWAILKGEKVLGATLHKVDTGIDTGEVIEETTFRISKNTTLYEAIEKSSHRLSLLFRKFLKRLEKKKPIALRKKKGGTTFSFPEPKHLEDFLKKGKRLW